MDPNSYYYYNQQANQYYADPQQSAYYDAYHQNQQLDPYYNYDHQLLQGAQGNAQYD